MQRRTFLLGAASLAGGGLGAPALIARGARAAEPALPLDDLRKALDPKSAGLLTPGDAQFARYLVSYNLRTLLTPQARVLAKAPQGIEAVVAWARANRVGLAVRSGGHSFEGFSQSRGLVVDTRPLDDIRIDKRADTVSVGAGQSIGAVYRRVAEEGFAFAAGSCPTVGVAGNTLGGGFGLLARHVGLAADNLGAVEAGDGRGRHFTADSARQADFFWACRAGGGGSFGVVTRFVFRVHPIRQVAVYGVSWTLPRPQAVRLMQAWQQWAPRARGELTSVIRIVRNGSELALRSIGLYVGSEAALRKELQPLLSAVGTPRPSIQAMSFMGSVNHFAGPDGWTYETKYMKAKSDYVTSAMSREGLETLMAGLQRLAPGAVVVICDAYGGALERLRADETAFAHRQGTLYGIQYYSQWGSAGQTPARETALRDLYRSMRPFVSGGAYVNYPDVELPEWGPKYWGANLARLQRVKVHYDPDNVFRHAQSVPLP